MNSWQQLGGNRETRWRNGLLSEKLSLSELPLATPKDVLAAATRACTEEEMARSRFSVGA